MTTPTERPLRFFSTSDAGRADRHFYAAGYSIDDACVLIAHAEGRENPYDNPYSAAHLSAYGSKRWGTSAEKMLEKKRGCYVVEGSLEWRDQSKTKVRFVEPPPHLPAHVPNASPSEAAARQPVPDDYGRFSSGITKRSKIDEWTFDSPHLKDRAKFRATVYLVRDGRFNRRRVGETEFCFLAESEVFKEIADTDIDRLRAKVVEAFRLHDLGQRGIVWEDWFEVVVIPERPMRYEEDGGARGAGFSIKYHTMKRGVHPTTGKALTINNNHVVTDFPKPKAARKPKKGKDGFDEDDDDQDGVSFEERDNRDARYQYAYIPATAKNRAALDSISTAIESAHARLQAILGQKEIEKTLAAVPAIPLLEEKKP